MFLFVVVFWFFVVVVDCTQMQTCYKQGIDSIVSRGMTVSERAEIWLLKTLSEEGGN